jgi:hypothetical protein
MRIIERGPIWSYFLSVGGAKGKDSVFIESPRGGFGIVAIDLVEMPPAALRRIPLTTWPRVQRAIEGSEMAGVILTSEPLARSAGGLTLSLAGRSTWTGLSARSRRLESVDVRVRVVSPRKRIDGDVVIKASCHDGSRG